MGPEGEHRAARMKGQLRCHPHSHPMLREPEGLRAREGSSQVVALWVKSREAIYTPGTFKICTCASEVSQTETLRGLSQ